MSLATYLFGAILAVVLVSVCYSARGICDVGPPGKFCFQDLTGYDDCHVDPKTGQMVDDKYKCPEGTRCTCMAIPCSVSNPCGTYRAPPKWPEDYHIEYYMIEKNCFPAGCHTTYSRLEQWRDTKNKMYRTDRTISSSSVYDYTIVLASNSAYEVYHIIPASRTCNKSTKELFPEKIPDIAPFFQYNGTEMITGINTQRWLWKAGGRYRGQPILTYIWNSYDNNKPLEYRYYDPGDQSSKTSESINAYSRLFVPGTPDPEVFELPKYCRRERKRFYPLTNLDTIYDDMQKPF